MSAKEDAFRKYVEAYDIPVPEERVQNELALIIQQENHRMQYDTLTTGRLHLNRGKELAERMNEMKQAAYDEVKSELVMKKILTQMNFSVSPKELEAKAAAIAESQDSSLEMVKRFFGEDLSGLERAVKEEKAIDWVYEQTGNS
ncbi:MAG TPA: hypothetical protein DF613_03985 [Lachnospiraceae bacterium]|nr:hypothetical protein [Lachnospiraceae bacterium]